MLNYKNPQLLIPTSNLQAGSITWRSPSNIAIIKYWGKHGVQLPRNPSISFTLDSAYTETTLSYQLKKNANPNIALDFTFHDKPNEAFRAKMVKFLSSISDIFPFLKQLELRIASTNSFPHSAGIASSASSMSALALCLCSLEKKLFQTLQNEAAFYKKASFVARLGSGSACRSVYDTLAIWGEVKGLSQTSDLYAVPYPHKVHEVFKTFHDDILIVSKGEKKVSSRAGHGLMEGNVYATSRYQQARQRFQELLVALEVGNLDSFGQIAEAEALTLHALMMASNPPYLLLHPNTLALIEKVQTFRRSTGLPLYFTLDAGPNLHLLYPHNISSQVQTFIQNELKSYCEDGRVISDRVGAGPVLL